MNRTNCRAKLDAGPGNAAYGMNRRNNRTMRLAGAAFDLDARPLAAVFSCLSITASTTARSNSFNADDLEQVRQTPRK